MSRRSRGVFLSRIFELFLPTDCRGIIIFITNYRISFTRNVAEITDFLCPEFANLRIFFFTRSVAECHGFFLITRLVLGPTDQREVIAELSNCFLPTECRGKIFFYHELSNYRIYFTRNVSEVTGFFVPIFFLVPNLRIIELFLHTEGRGVSRFFLFTRLVLGPTDQREVIAEFLSITRIVADGCGACSSCEWGLFVVVYRPIRGVCV